MWRISMKATPVATRPPRLFGTPRAREVAAHQKAKKQVQTAKRRNDAVFLDVYGRTTGVWTYRRTNAHDGPRLRPHQDRARVAGLPNKLPTLCTAIEQRHQDLTKSCALDAIEQT